MIAESKASEVQLRLSNLLTKVNWPFMQISFKADKFLVHKAFWDNNFRELFLEFDCIW